MLTKFFLFTSAHVASHFIGTITNDFASEFDPFSPQFGEKFGRAQRPVAVKDFSGREISRVYADQWGIFNGLTSSSWTVLPAQPERLHPELMIACMNDPGPIRDTRRLADARADDHRPGLQPGVQQLLLRTPYMPGQPSTWTPRRADACRSRRLQPA